jgi:arylsulfatase A-like enzyme
VRTPVLQALIDGGSFHPRAQAELPSSTLPNHASMLSGLTVFHHGVIFNSDRDGRIGKTTLIDAARTAGLRAGFFASKTKFRYLCNDGQADAWAIETDVDRITDAVITALQDANLDLVFLHYGEPDGAGHKHGWMTDEYFAQVTRTDAALGRVLAALDAAGTRDNTLVIVTSDHGGHGKSHGLPIADDVNVPFILNGPNIAPGRALDTGDFAMANPPRPMDAAANALAALGISIDGAGLDEKGVGGVKGIDGVVTLEARTDYIPTDKATLFVFGLPCGPLPPLMLFAIPFALHAIRRIRPD